MKDVQYLSHMATLATDGNYINQLTTNAPHAINWLVSIWWGETLIVNGLRTFTSPSRNSDEKEKEKKKKSRMTIAKLERYKQTQ